MGEYDFLTIRDVEAFYISGYRLVLNDGQIVDVVEEGE